MGTKRSTNGCNKGKSARSQIKHKIAVISGKGGVGKSLVTVNLAISLAKEGNKVGIFDADLTGPCVPKMLGLKGNKLEAGPTGIGPAIGPEGVKTVSMDFLLPSDESPVIWRGPLKMGAIRQFLGEVNWGPLDYLLVDLPPGTGDESLSILQLLPEMDGVVIVTIPSEVSQSVVKKAVTFARQMKVPIFGIVENMAGMVCPHCGEMIEVFSSGGGAKVSDEMKVDLLGSIQMDPRIATDSDLGTPFARAPAAKIFSQIARAGRYGRIPHPVYINHTSTIKAFNPEPESHGEPIQIEPAELEAIRLTDLENLNQEQAGERMGVSRGTIWRLLQRGRTKIAHALIEGHRIEIRESPE